MELFYLLSFSFYLIAFRIANAKIDGTMPLAWQASFGKAHQLVVARCCAKDGVVCLSPKW